MKKHIVLLVGILLLGSIHGAEAPKDNDIKQFLNSFIEAFDNLEWERFRSFFADDATVFYPRQFPHRATGRQEFEAHFRQVFAQIKSGRPSPPYMQLQPRDMRIQALSDSAIVTFHLDDRPGFLNRRTIVLGKIDGKWKIIHLHASEVKTD